MLITQLPCDCSVSSLAVPKAPTGNFTIVTPVILLLVIIFHRLFAISDWNQGRGKKFQLWGHHQQLWAVLEWDGGCVWGWPAHRPPEQPRLHRLRPVGARLLRHLLQAGGHPGLPDVRAEGRQCSISCQRRGSLLRWLSLHSSRTTSWRCHGEIYGGKVRHTTQHNLIIYQIWNKKDQKIHYFPTTHP